MMRIVAHRGWSGLAPENTLAAFEMAMAEPDIYAVELDVHLSKDGVPVVIHDHTIDRTTDGHGNVSAYTLDELKRFDAGGWFDSRFAGERIPSLDEVLALAKGRCLLHVELKTAGDLYPGIEAKVVEALRKRGMTDQAVLSSFDHDSMMRAKEAGPEIDTCLIFLGKPVLLAEQLRITRASGLSIHYAYMTKKLMDQMEGLGIDTGLWTVDDPEHLAKIAAEYPQARVTTNYPDRLLGIVRQSAGA